MNKRTKQFVGLGIVLSALIGASFTFWLPNTKPFKDRKFLYVRTGMTRQDVDQELINKNIVKHPQWYYLAAKLMGFGDDDIKPGKYLISNSTSNYSIIHHISNQLEEEVVLKFSGLHTPPQLADLLYSNLESTPEDIQKFLFDKNVLAKWGVDSVNLFAAFFSNSKKTTWSKSFKTVVEEMHDEVKKFWTSENNQKANALGLTQNEVMTLAAIVQSEIMHDEEAGTVARVYLNRLSKQMRLQADPTVVFAVGDFDIRRVTLAHLKTPSPFNTYLVKGLPPAPIKLVRPEIVKAVLTAPQHDFIFFCADPNRSGYHKFFTNYEDHKRFAEEYHKSLDQRKIY